MCMVVKLWLYGTVGLLPTLRTKRENRAMTWNNMRRWDEKRFKSGLVYFLIYSTCDARFLGEAASSGSVLKWLLKLESLLKLNLKQPLLPKCFKHFYLHLVLHVCILLFRFLPINFIKNENIIHIHFQNLIFLSLDFWAETNLGNGLNFFTS